MGNECSLCDAASTNLKNEMKSIEESELPVSLIEQNTPNTYNREMGERREQESAGAVGN